MLSSYLCACIKSYFYWIPYYSRAAWHIGSEGCSMSQGWRKLSKIYLYFSLANSYVYRQDIRCYSSTLCVEYTYIYIILYIELLIMAWKPVRHRQYDVWSRANSESVIHRKCRFPVFITILKNRNQSIKLASYQAMHYVYY